MHIFKALIYFNQNIKKELNAEVLQNLGLTLNHNICLYTHSFMT